MPRRSDPRADALAVRLLRAFRDCTQRDLAKAAGLHPTTISRYEKGRITPRRSTLLHLAAGSGVPLAVLEEFLLPLFRFAGTAQTAESLDYGVGKDRSRLTAEILRSVSASILAVLGGLSFERIREPAFRKEIPNPPSPATLLDRLLAFPPGERRVWIERVEEFRRWEVCVLACEASESAVGQAAQARDLAELAVAIAERVSGSDLWRARLQGFAWAFVGKALAIANDPREAERALSTARRLWQVGADSDPGLLNASRVFDL